MNKTILGLLSFVLLSCAPMRHAVNVEMRYPSKSGIDLNGKNISVVYLENDNRITSGFAEGVADGLAYSLEQDYGTGEGSIGIYSIPLRGQESDYSSRDSLISLLVETNSDVILLLDTLEIGRRSEGESYVNTPVSPDSTYLNNSRVPFKIALYCLDAMDPSEKVYSFKGSSLALSLRQEVGFEAGQTISSSFKSQWKHEQYSIIYYDSQLWYHAVAYADSYSWKAAMDIWIDLLDTKDMMKRSSASYNIAVACYMMGDYALASEWLDRSDADNKLPLSDAMRKRIDARM